MPDEATAVPAESGTRFSIVVPVRNVEATIARTLDSVLNQQHAPKPEIILVDGASTDGTMRAVAPFAPEIACVISEPDDGLYDAINKGIAQASGDVIGILNGDDYYAHPNVLAAYSTAFAEAGVDLVYADLVFFAADNPERIRRLYSSRHFQPEQLLAGWMPPHPTVFIRREAYGRIGPYRTDYRIAADYELMVRALLVHRLTYRRIDDVVVRMQLGGMSTAGLRATYTLNSEIIRACRENGFQTGWHRLLAKFPAKLKDLRFGR